MMPNNQISTDVKDEKQTDLTLLAVISNAASNPDVDVAKMQALLSMQAQIETREAQKAFEQAFIKMQMELPEISKNGAITNKLGAVQSRYAKWEDIDRAVRPVLQAHGFALRFDISSQDNMIQVAAILSHVGGHVEKSGFMKLPNDSSGSKNGVQGVGSSVAYGKRYCAITMLNIVTHEDNDGQSSKQEHQEMPQELRANCEAAAQNGEYESFYKSLEPAARDLIYRGHFEDHVKWKKESEGKAKPAAKDYPKADFSQFEG